jgi:hypothetical protein
MLAPIGSGSGARGSTDPRLSLPIKWGEIADPSRTIMFVETSFDRSPTGAPIGGGHWLVDPPCMRGTGSTKISPLPAAYVTSIWVGGWSLQAGDRYEFGNAYPWHNRRFLVSMVDGTVKALTQDELTAGCELKVGSSGPAYDLDAYLWDSIK